MAASRWSCCGIGTPPPRFAESPPAAGRLKAATTTDTRTHRCKPASASLGVASQRPLGLGIRHARALRRDPRHGRRRTDRPRRTPPHHRRPALPLDAVAEVLVLLEPTLAHLRRQAYPGPVNGDAEFSLARACRSRSSRPPGVARGGFRAYRPLRVVGLGARTLAPASGLECGLQHRA